MLMLCRRDTFTLDMLQIPQGAGSGEYAEGSFISRRACS